MKKIISITSFLLLSIMCVCQVPYNSSYSINRVTKIEIEQKNRTVILSDTDISISNFIDGGNVTQYLTVDSAKFKDWGEFDGIRKTYYCTTKDSNFINGYQKVILYVNKHDLLEVAIFADEISIYRYSINLENY